jgi:predicted nucleotidyltransferase
MVSIIDEHHKELINLCRKYYVKRLDVFGSIVTDDFSQSSDIDFLVEFDSKVNPRRFDNFFELYRALENLFVRPIDLVEPGGLNNPYFIRQINKTRRNIYASS